MLKNIVIIDYGAGNHFSVHKKLNRLGYKVTTSNNIDKIRSADKIVMPGVGHFGKAMENLKQLNLIDVLNEEVLNNNKPILGICLGMQLMASYSEEGNIKGLNWFDATVEKFKINNQLLHKVPHTGWNQIKINKESTLLKKIPNKSEFYFVHSYYFKCNNQSDILCETQYESKFVSAIEKKNIYGTQFHPEKSHDIGMQLLKNFIEL